MKVRGKRGRCQVRGGCLVRAGAPETRKVPGEWRLQVKGGQVQGVCGGVPV